MHFLQKEIKIFHDIANGLNMDTQSSSHRHSKRHNFWNLNIFQDDAKRISLARYFFPKLLLQIHILDSHLD
eukprot:09530.XXX_324697_324909_1 [CDS] Oithona nana genome sequencing.